MNRTPRDLWIVVIAYVLATLAGAAILWMLRDRHTLFALAAADVVATLVIFAFSMRFRNASLYDPYWSVAPLLLVVGLFFLEPHGDRTRQLLVLLAMAPWGIRLTWNWWRGWGGLSHEDWRYRMLQEKHGRLYPLVNLGGIHLFPTVLVFLGLLGAWALFRVESPISWLEIVLLLICPAAAVIQGLADNQLRRFRLSKPAPEAWIDEGLWRYSRHPNYFGEVLFWWGLGLAALAAGAPLFVLVGPIAMTALFFFISIPMMEERMLAKRPSYSLQIERVSRLVPLPRRRT